MGVLIQPEAYAVWGVKAWKGFGTPALRHKHVFTLCLFYMKQENNLFNLNITELKGWQLQWKVLHIYTFIMKHETFFFLFILTDNYMLTYKF